MLQSHYPLQIQRPIPNTILFDHHVVVASGSARDLAPVNNPTEREHCSQRRHLVEAVPNAIVARREPADPPHPPRTSSRARRRLSCRHRARSCAFVEQSCVRLSNFKAGTCACRHCDGLKLGMFAQRHARMAVAANVWPFHRTRQIERRQGESTRS